MPAKKTVSRVRQRTRAHLVDAALLVFAEKGDGVPALEHFAKAAGMSRGTYYSYFPDRDQLQFAVTERILALAARELAPHCAASDDPAYQVALALHGFFDLCLANPAWGWACIHTGPRTLRSLPNEAVGGFIDMLANGTAAGRFDIRDQDAALDVIAGAVPSALRSMLTTESSKIQADAVTLFLLHALGLSYNEAAGIISSLPKMNVTVRWFET